MAKKTTGAVQDVSPTQVSNSNGEIEVPVTQPGIIQTDNGMTMAASEKAAPQIQSVEGTNYPHGVKLVTISACVALSVFLVALVS